MQIDIEGWYINDEKQKDVNTEDIYLSTKLYSKSVRRFEVSDLVIVDFEKVIGGFLNFIILTMVVNTKGSLNPFYIDEKNKPKLQALVNKYKKADVITL